MQHHLGTRDLWTAAVGMAVSMVMPLYPTLTALLTIYASTSNALYCAPA